MKKNWKLFSRNNVPAVICLFAGIFLFSCSHNSPDSSFVSALELTDSYIRLGQTADALKSLKKTSKSAYSAYARLGIYKRYEQLGETKLAEKTLVKALKKIPDSLELKAVYSQFLIKNGRIEDALEVSPVLAGTKYGSIYSYCVLNSSEKEEILENSLFKIYNDCYEATENEQWLLKSAIPYLKNGEYEQAASLQKTFETKNPLFWSKVQFDAGNYDLCIQNLENADKNKVEAKLILLASDAFYLLGDFDSAEKERLKLLEMNADVQNFALTYVNSAIWAYNAKQYARSYDLLMRVIMSGCENIPSLLTYGKFAREDAEESEEDFFERELRKTTLRSYSMQQKDERPRFLIDDAIFRIEELIKKQKQNKSTVDDDLLVERLALWLSKWSDAVQNKKEAEIWQTLENNETAGSLYPPKLVNFAVCYLLNSGKEKEARELFEKYLDCRYKLKEKTEKKEAVVYDVFGGEKRYSAPEVPDFVIKAAFGDRASEYAPTMELWEVEMAAYFSLLDENFSAGKRLYEYALFETGGVKAKQNSEQITAFNRMCNVSSAVNLASVYAGTGELNRALSLYGLAGGRTKNKKLKSKILYRTALVQSDMQNKDGAILSLEYAVSLNPMNAEARLLEKKLKN